MKHCRQRSFLRPQFGAHIVQKLFRHAECRHSDLNRFPANQI